MALLDGSTGRPPTGLDEKALGEPNVLSCWHDQRSTIVCAAKKRSDERVFALDATTFKELWSIDSKDKSRLLPNVTTAWHGAVYTFTDNGPVVLDALTGKDKATGVGLAPSEVNDYAGLSGRREISAHPAIGQGQHATHHTTVSRPTQGPPNPSTPKGGLWRGLGCLSGSVIAGLG
ncbi:hypothetical protein WKI68_42240 [Streptomyces sp. MS1.HAVA.3]|uniref:Uncharacterized protein n=1 Tax=Streptomyces caledonius TaxID=3134107 RepID=A0ABU8UDU6_9ACTN